MSQVDQSFILSRKSTNLVQTSLKSLRLKYETLLLFVLFKAQVNSSFGESCLKKDKPHSSQVQVKFSFFCYLSWIQVQVKSQVLSN